MNFDIINGSLLQQALDIFRETLAQGGARIKPHLMVLMGFLVFFEMVRVCTAILLQEASVLHLVRAIVRAMVWVWIFNGYPSLTTMVYQSMVWLGLLAGGNALTVAQFLDPGAWLDNGFRIGKVFYDAMTANLGLTTGVLALGYLIGWAMLVAAYAFMGVTLFILQAELTIVVLAAVVLLPFGVVKGLGWIAQGALAYPVNVAFKFFILALVAAGTFPIIRAAGTVSATIPNAFIMVVLSATLAFLFLKGPKIAASILAGLPALGAGEFIAAGVGSALIAGAGVGVAVAAGSAGLYGATRLASGAAQAAGIVRTQGMGGLASAGLSGAKSAAGHLLSRASQRPPHGAIRDALKQTLTTTARHAPSEGHGSGTSPHL